VERIEFTSSSVLRFVYGGADSGLIGAPLALVHGSRMASSGTQSLRAVAALDGHLSATEFGHWPPMTHAAGV
jgi:hypothetical protein